MKKHLKYYITLAVDAVLVLLFASFRDIWSSETLENTYHILCDAFFVVGVFTTCIGLLFFVTNEGIFDGLIYSVKSFINMHRRNMKREHATFYDYKESLASRRLPFGFLVICGSVFLAVSVVMYWLYSQQL